MILYYEIRMLALELNKLYITKRDESLKFAWFLLENKANTKKEKQKQKQFTREKSSPNSGDQPRSETSLLSCRWRHIQAAEGPKESLHVHQTHNHIHFLALALPRQDHLIWVEKFVLCSWNIT